MDTGTPPLLIGLAAAILLGLVFSVVPETQRMFGRLLIPRWRRSETAEAEITGERWVYESPARRHEHVGRAVPISQLDGVGHEPSGDPEEERKVAENIEDLRMEARERARIMNELAQERAALEETRMRLDSLAAVQEAELRAEELLVAAGRQCESLVREAEEEAERKAAEITEEARRHTRELIEEFELEAKRIVDAADRERTRVRNELAQERSALEETRTRLESLVAIERAVEQGMEEYKAEEPLVARGLRPEDLRRQGEAEAERTIEDAQRQAQELLEQAELEAKEIVARTDKERSRVLDELAQERALLAETRSKLDSLTVIDEAARQAEELLAVAERRRDDMRRESEEEAERRATEIVVDARREAQDLLAAAEQRRDDLRRESEEEAERRATEIVADARRRTQELHQEAELEATRIIGVAGQERDRLVDELARRRSALEETRTTLSGFLSDVLEEVERPPVRPGVS